MFDLGRIVITRAALAFCERTAVNALDLLQRHVLGDWGDLCSQDKEANRTALKLGGRIFSSYQVQGTKLFVITEADRSYTTILMATDY